MKASSDVTHNNKTLYDNIDQKQHRSVHVSSYEQQFRHLEAKWPLVQQRDRKTPLKYPRANDPLWKQWNDELTTALPNLFPRNKLKTVSLEKYEAWLYNFITDRFPQPDPAPSTDSNASNSVNRCITALDKLRQQKKELTKFMKNCKKKWFMVWPTCQEHYQNLEEINEASQ
jgi:hypothetical protein